MAGTALKNSMGCVGISIGPNDGLKLKVSVSGWSTVGCRLEVCGKVRMK